MIPTLKLSILFLILAIAACDDSWESTSVLEPSEIINGSGTIVEELRSASGCVGVTMGGEGILHIEQGSRTELLVRADDNLLPYIVTEMAGGHLTIRNENGVDLRPSRNIEYFLTVVDIEEVVLAGAGGVDSSNLQADRLTIIQTGVGGIQLDNLDVETLEVEQSGAGTVRLTGAVFEQSVTMSGYGDYEAGELQSAEADIHTSGVGSATLRVSDRLVATISGVGCVYYIGDPTVASTIIGAGRLERVAG